MNPAEIEARERQRDEWHELEKIALDEICSQCGAGLLVPWDAQTNSAVLRCSRDKTHQGHTKPDYALERLHAMRMSAFEGGDSTELIDAEIQSYQIHKNMKGGKDMESTALQQYRETHVITKEQALEVIRTTPGWEKAPENVVMRAALICRDYKVYPGIHLFLLPFELKDGSTSWAPVFGIKFNRLAASRRKPYKYVDGPRRASDEEAQKHFLDDYNHELIYAYCRVQGLDGSEADGWGTWPRSKTPYGADKGNSKSNMAEIRAERRALDRLCPGELPAGFDVVDEQYLSPGIESPALPFPEGSRVVDQATGEIVDTPPTEAPSEKQGPPPAKFGVCPVHHMPLIEGNSGSVYCPKKVDGKWCKEWKAKKNGEQPPLAEAQ